jgi:hypothetical protein
LAQILESFVDAAATPVERVATTRTLYDTFARGLGALGLTAIWGLMAGAAAPRLALANVYKVPMVVAFVGVTVTLAMLQLVALATPVLTLPTVFGGGIEGVLR